MISRVNLIICILLLIGLVFRLLMTWDGNFIFNIDNARDYVDVREMVVGGKFRLTGPTSAIEGVFNGPFWYYLLSIPFVLGNGHPYAAVLMMIVLWVIGGYFLLKLVSRWGILAILVAGIIWAFSNYMSLATAYAFNPHPVTLLAPLFIYLLEKYLNNSRGIYLISAFGLGGLFFNFEMNFGFIIPLIIFMSLFIYYRFQFLKRREFWIGSFVFLLFLLPQVIFDLKHQFIMTKSLIRYLSTNESGSYNPLNRIFLISKNFYDTFVPTYFNQKYFVQLMFVLFAIFVMLNVRSKKLLKNKLLIVASVFIVIPYIVYILIPVTINSWHLGAICTTTIILLGFIIGDLKNIKKLGIYFSSMILLVLIYYSYLNLADFTVNFGKPSKDPSNFKNELAAIDYVYQKTKGQNFKVYIYLPSIIDYPYQYLFWWRGTRKYGYLPEDYAYLPEKPKYIGSKEKFENKKMVESSGLTFLIKEPDRIGFRHLWENNFRNLETVSKEMIGPIEIENKKSKPPLNK